MGWGTGKMIVGQGNAADAGQDQYIRSLAGNMNQVGATVNAAGGVQFGGNTAAHPSYLPYGSGITLPAASPSSKTIAGFVNNPAGAAAAAGVPATPATPAAPVGGSAQAASPTSFDQMYRQRYGDATVNASNAALANPGPSTKPVYNPATGTYSTIPVPGGDSWKQPAIPNPNYDPTATDQGRYVADIIARMAGNGGYGAVAPLANPAGAAHVVPSTPGAANATRISSGGPQLATAPTSKSLPVNQSTPATSITGANFGPDWPLDQYGRMPDGTNPATLGIPPGMSYANWKMFQQLQSQMGLGGTGGQGGGNAGGFGGYGGGDPSQGGGIGEGQG